MGLPLTRAEYCLRGQWDCQELNAVLGVNGIATN